MGCDTMSPHPLHMGNTLVWSWGGLLAIRAAAPPRAQTRPRAAAHPCCMLFSSPSRERIDSRLQQPYAGGCSRQEGPYRQAIPQGHVFQHQCWRISLFAHAFPREMFGPEWAPEFLHTAEYRGELSGLPDPRVTTSHAHQPAHLQFPGSMVLDPLPADMWTSRDQQFHFEISDYRCCMWRRRCQQFHFEIGDHRCCMWTTRYQQFHFETWIGQVFIIDRRVTAAYST